VMNITLLAKKGGVGKSTVCILLYEAFRQAGKTVSIHDWDTQGTSTKALELFGAQMPPASRKADIVIWDTPPNLDHIATPNRRPDAGASPQSEQPCRAQEQGREVSWPLGWPDRAFDQPTAWLSDPRSARPKRAGNSSKPIDRLRSWMAGSSNIKPNETKQSH